MFTKRLRMKCEEPEPLWQSVVGEKEPWRRGRLFLIFFALLSALSDLFVCALLLLGGYVEPLFIFAVARTLFWLQFYFIWIGVHWVRWLQGGLCMLYGFWLFIWSLGAQSGAIMMWGIFSVAAGSYLGFAPAVHFFAKRQQKNRNWRESFAVAVIFGLLLLTLASGVLGLVGYKTYVQQNAREFADNAFERIFAGHDTYFLLDHVTVRLLNPPHGRSDLTKFLQDATMRAGDIRAIQKANGFVSLRYSFPVSFVAEGEMRTEGVGSKGRVLMRMRLVGASGDWKIDEITWLFPDSFRKR
jgi:hypothetical protein